MLNDILKEKLPGFFFVFLVVILGSIISNYINQFIIIETITIVIFLGILVFILT